MAVQELKTAGSLRCIPSGTSGLLALVLLCAALLVPGVSVGQTEVSGEISGEWTAEGNPYIIIDSTWIPENQELRINPGVEALFEADMGIWIFGRLIARGQEEDSIRFKSQSDSTTWQSLYLIGSDEPQEFDYCVISDAFYGITFSEDDIRLYVGHSVVSGEEKAIGGIRGNPVYGMRINIDHSILLGNPCIKNARSSGINITNSTVYRNIWGMDRITAVECTFYDDVETMYADYSDCRFFFSGDTAAHPRVGLGGGDMINCFSEVAIRINVGPCHLSQLECTNQVSGDGDISLDSCIIAELDVSPDGRDEELRMRNCTILEDLDVSSDRRIEIIKSVVFNDTWLSGDGNINIDSSEFHRIEGESSLMILDAGDSESIRMTNCLVTVPVRISGGETIEFLNNTFCFYKTYHEAIDNWARYSSMILRNNIIYAAVDSLTLFNNPWAENTLPIFQYNSIFGFEELFWHERGVFEIDSTNLFTDPLFVSLFYSDFHLLSDSPCIDAGDPDSPLDPDGTRADIGAFYFPQEQFIPIVKTGYTSSFDLLSFYPNPCNAKVTFFNPTQSFVNYGVIDLFGRLVLDFNHIEIAPGSQNTIDIQGLSTGTYFVLAKQNGRSINKKLIVQK